MKNLSGLIYMRLCGDEWLTHQLTDEEDESLEVVTS